MVRRIFLLFTSLFIGGLLANAQEVEVVDIVSGEPISHVTIYDVHKKNSSLTNEKGIADISKFHSDANIVFRHTAYQELILPYTAIRDFGFRVSLRPALFNLDEVVISANRWEEKRDEIPNKIVVINQKEIALNNPQTSADLLSSSGEVFVQKSQLGGGSPMIRGFSANKVLLVYDGVRMNNAIFRGGNLQNVILIDPLSLENAEVIFGPGSVVYGSDALGGVMDFHSTRVKLQGEDDEEKNVFGSALFRKSSANDELTAHIDFGIAGKKFGSYTSITFSDYKDLRQGSNGNSYLKRESYVDTYKGRDTLLVNSDPNEQKFSGYSQVNFLQKFRYKPSKTVDLGAEFLYSNSSNIPRYDRLIQEKKGKPKYAEWYYGPQRWMLGSINGKISESNIMFDDMKFNLAYQNYEESRNKRKFQNSNLDSQVEKVNAYSLNLDFTKGLFSNVALFYGLESIVNTVDSHGERKNINSGSTKEHKSRYPDGGSDYYSNAAYASIRWNLCEKFTINSGVRYSQVSLDAKFDNLSLFDLPFDKVPELKNIKLDNGALNGSFGVVYRPFKSLILDMNLSSGFRAPNLDDVSKIFDSGDGILVVPNPDLKPEYANNIDLGLTINIAAKGRLGVRGFYTKLKDAMVRRDFNLGGVTHINYDGTPSKIQALVNVGSATIYGASASLSYDILPFMNLHSSFTYTQGEDEDKLPLRHVSPLFGQTGLTFTFDKIIFELWHEYNGEISYANLAPSERDKAYLYAADGDGNPYSPEWMTINAKTSIYLSKRMQVNLSVTNITDQRYRPYSSGISAAGRNFIISIKGTI
ncbi:MAG: TonB-dependent receptor domain-containing protein [Hyphomicrobiales bacterium]